MNIFFKNINNKFKLMPFNLNLRYKGETKYFPPTSKEWKNSIYPFYSNSLKNLPVYDLKINKLIKGYFNLYFNRKAMFKKMKSYKLRRISVRRIFVSKAEIKHTSTTALITIYVLDKQRRSLQLSIQRLNIKKIVFIINKFLHKNIYKNISKEKKYKILKLMFLKKFELMYKYSLNLYKYQEIFINKLSWLISKYYGKIIEFRIVKLKNLVYNPDLFTEVLTLKMKKRVRIASRMNYIMNKAVLPRVNNVQERIRRIKDLKIPLKINKYKSNNLSCVLMNNNLENFLSEELYNDVISAELKAEHSVDKENNLENKPTEKNFFNKDSIAKQANNQIFAEDTKVKRIVFNSIKYKNMSGIRLEISGRLTRRYRADRAVFRLRRKGGLKNIDSSYKGLSTVIFKGYQNCNVEYSIHTSKRRIGAFAVKGWISGK